MNQSDSDTVSLISTGIAGLDDVLYGGLVPHRLYLVEGDPGSGKTTLALQFLLAGCADGERCMFVTLSETKEELRSSARGHGWSLDQIDIVEIVPHEESLKSDSRYTMFHPSEIELGETTNKVLDLVENTKPTRLVLDSLSELRLLAQNPLRYRRQILALKQFFSRQQCTVLFIDDKTEISDMHLHSVAHGVISFERRAPEYGVLRRRLQIPKMRGRTFREGYHDVRILRGGMRVYPRLIPDDQPIDFVRKPIKSGLDELDALTGGGLAPGTSNLILGPAGTGKSSIAIQYAAWAAAHGANASVYIFDESVATLLERSAGLGMRLESLIASGRLAIRHVNAAELTPGEFADDVRNGVLQEQTRMVVIDSLNGYLSAMPSEQFLILHLHELLAFLGQHGVTTLLIEAQHGLAGPDFQAPIDASYLADTILVLRYFEALGEVRQAISVIKKRTGNHERTIRELRLANGIVIGEPVREFQGVLSGAPVFVGSGSQQLIQGKSG